jgi:hypothetical protein
MKTQVSFIAILGVALITISASPLSEKKIVIKSKAELKSQTNTDFSFFRTHRQGKNGVTSTWGMNAENGVISYSLMKTYEDASDPYAYWEEVCSMPCNSSRSYKWNDANVFPGYISYCVVAHMSDGSTVTTWVNTIHIVSH